MRTILPLPQKGLTFNHDSNDYRMDRKCVVWLQADAAPVLPRVSFPHRRLGMITMHALPANPSIPFLGAPILKSYYGYQSIHPSDYIVANDESLWRVCLVGALGTHALKAHDARTKEWKSAEQHPSVTYTLTC
jgi:hypothetical protein